MHGLVDVDVTDARRLLAEHDPPLSLTAFVVGSVARAAAAFPEVHAYRNWRGQLVEHCHVDVQTLVEVPTAQGPFGLVHVVRDADVRDVADISSELRPVKIQPTTTASGRMLEALAPLAGRVPGLFRAMYAVMGRSVRVRLQTGTVQVTAVGMFAGGGRLRDRSTILGLAAGRRRRSQPTSARRRRAARRTRRARPDGHD